MSAPTEPRQVLLDRLPANVALVDHRGVVREVNRRWRQFARENGYRGGRFGIGTSYLEVCDRARGPSAVGAREIHDGLTRVLAGEIEEFRHEYPCPGPDGQRWFLAVLGALRNGEEAGAVVMHFDVSERWRAQLQVRELEDAMGRVTRLALLGEMASEMAHELNQPLTATLSFLYAANKRLGGLSGPEADSVADLIDQAQEQVDRAGRIIRDMRRFVGRLEPAIEATDPKTLVDDTVTLATAGARPHGVSIRVELAPDLPRILVDRLQIQQMLINVLRNAVEASERSGAGLVDLAVRRAGDRLEISVADRGPGLPPDQARRLFKAFVTGKPEGLGLGLAIARRVAEAHGGTIEAAGRPGGGAIFRMLLPVLGGPAARGDAGDA